jgi:hypothetical protein
MNLIKIIKGPSAEEIEREKKNAEYWKRYDAERLRNEKLARIRDAERQAARELQEKLDAMPPLKRILYHFPMKPSQAEKRDPDLREQYKVRWCKETEFALMEADFLTQDEKLSLLPQVAEAAERWLPVLPSSRPKRTAQEIIKAANTQPGSIDDLPPALRPVSEDELLDRLARAINPTKPQPLGTIRLDRKNGE